MFKRIIMCCSVFFKLLRVFWQMLYGVWYVSRLPEPIVSIFGGARFKNNDFYFKQAHRLAQNLVSADISVLTGGGPGIMEAANCGAVVVKGGRAKTMGIGVTDLQEKENDCVDLSIMLDYFFARKYLLTRFSTAFVVFPGGFGTLDEVAEVITLIQTKQSRPEPIIFFGIEYWSPFIQWLHDEALKHGTISKQDLDIFTVTDDLDRVFCLVRDECKL